MQKLKGLSLPSFGGGNSSSGTQFQYTDDAIDQSVAQVLDERKLTVRALSSTVTRFHRTHSKVYTNPNSTATSAIGFVAPSSSSDCDLPVVWVASELLAGAERLRACPDKHGIGLSQYSALLESAGKAELAVGRGAAQFADTLDTHVVQELDQLLASYKEYEKVSKDADKARSNLEAKLAKKAKTGADDGSELQAELEYEDACGALTHVANHLLSCLPTEQAVVEALIDAQLSFAHLQTEALQECRDKLSSQRMQGRPASPVLTRVAPKAATRASRSASDSTVKRMQDAAKSSSRPSSGPSSRRSTVGSADKDVDGSGSAPPKLEALKSRSRSSSMLGRFAPTNMLGRKKDKGQMEDPDFADEYDAERARTYDGDDRDGRGSRSRGHSPTSSRFANGASAFRLGSNNSGYNGLREDVRSGVSLSPATSSLARRPTPLKRTHTAPNPRLSSDAERDLDDGGSLDAGATYVQARWPFKPAASAESDATGAGADDELELERGDIVRVVRHVNDDWWIGVVVVPAESSTSGTSSKSRRRQSEGREGMFPSAYVVEVDPPNKPKPRASRAQGSPALPPRRAGPGNGGSPVLARRTTLSDDDDDDDWRHGHGRAMTATEDSSDDGQHDEDSDKRGVLGSRNGPSSSGTTTPKRFVPGLPSRKFGVSSNASGTRISGNEQSPFAD